MKRNAGHTHVFPPGEFIREELRARGWTQSDLANILGRPVQAVNEIIKGKKTVTPETALGLAAAFGTSAEVWLNLENTYRLSLVKSDPHDVSRRSRLYSLVPAKELIKRGWIDASDDLDRLEQQVCQFLDIDSIDQEPRFAFVARKSGDYKQFSSAQIAWFCRARQRACQSKAKRFDRQKFRAQVHLLPRLSRNENGLRELPVAMANLGLRLVIVEHLPKTYIDGAAFWLNQESPVVALSIRYDRIDYFWFTLMHELAHISLDARCTGYVDENLVGPSAETNAAKPRSEQEADHRASEWLVRSEALEEFIRRTRPYYSRGRIVGFAEEIGVHPGIIVGRLQHLREIEYSHNRALLTRIRKTLMEVI